MNFVPQSIFKVYIVYTFEHFYTKLNIMSSNIKVQRICQHCGNEFTAKTTVTRFCSHRCGSLANKAMKRAEKVQKSNIETKQIKNLPVEELKTREFLTVTQVSKLIGCSRQNIYKLINAGKLKATNILQKKTIVRRSDLDKLFNQVKTERIPEIQEQGLNELAQTEVFDISECYTLTEVQNKYNIAEKTLYDLIRRNGIPK